MQQLLSRIGLTMALVLGTSGCFSTTPKLMYDQTHAARLLVERLGPEAEQIPVPYAIDAEMAEFARRAVTGERTTRGRIDALTDAIVGKSGLHVQYEITSTLTARQVFELRRANCISSASLFIGLARSVGLEAFYADVTERSHYMRRAGTIIHVGHVAAVVREGSQLLLVDFAQQAHRKYLGFRLIDDIEAVAYFVINQGVDFGELFAMPDSSTHAFRFTQAQIDKFRLALRIRPGFAKGLLNLGTAWILEGNPAEAERCFRAAIRSDPSFAPAYTALASLEYSQRRFDDALKLYETAIDHQKNNPYLHYNLALTKFTLRRYDEAANSARSAVQLEPEFADAHYLLGIIAQIVGQRHEARTRFRQALSLDPQMDDARTRLRHVEHELSGEASGGALTISSADSLR